ncbi:MAG: M28 family peptidase [Alistipes sp.]|nr:M28 family peptidase [Alistipes sp.]
MKYILLLIIYFSCISCAEFNSDFDIEFLESQEGKWVNYLCSKECSGRISGTEGGEKAFDFIVKELRSMGCDYQIQEFYHYDGTLLRNIIVSIKGSSDSLIVVGAHYDGQCESNARYHFPAANDNVSGVVALLHFLDNMQAKELGNSLHVCFWDGEEAVVPPAFKGSKYYLTMSSLDIKLYINCDTIGYGTDLYIKYSEYTENEEYDLINFLGEYDSNCHLILTDNFTSDDYSFYSSGLATIGITDGSYSFMSPKYPIHTIYDTPNKISLSQLHKASELIYSIIDYVN